MKKSLEEIASLYKENKLDKIEFVREVYKALNVPLRKYKNIIKALINYYDLDSYEIRYESSETIDELFDEHGVKIGIFKLNTDECKNKKYIIVNEKYSNTNLINIDISLEFINTTMLLYTMVIIDDTFTNDETIVICVTEREFAEFGDVQELSILLQAPIPLLGKIQRKLFCRSAKSISSKYVLTERNANFIYNKYLK